MTVDDDGISFRNIDEYGEKQIIKSFRTTKIAEVREYVQQLWKEMAPNGYLNFINNRYCQDSNSSDQEELIEFNSSKNLECQEEGSKNISSSQTSVLSCDEISETDEEIAKDMDLITDPNIQDNALEEASKTEQGSNNIAFSSQSIDIVIDEGSVSSKHQEQTRVRDEDVVEPKASELTNIAKCLLKILQNEEDLIREFNTLLLKCANDKYCTKLNDYRSTVARLQTKIPDKCVKLMDFFESDKIWTPFGHKF